MGEGRPIMSYADVLVDLPPGLCVVLADMLGDAAAIVVPPPISPEPNTSSSAITGSVTREVGQWLMR